MFSLHSQLEKDSHQLIDEKKFILLLHHNKIIPWLIYVPKTNTLHTEDLEFSYYQNMMANIYKISQFSKKYFQLEKINLASIGNIVPQIHWHIVSRKDTDCCWPKPIWGNIQEYQDYSKEEIEKIKQEIEKSLGL